MFVYVIMVALLGSEVHDTNIDIAVQIERVCEDEECIADALASCYLETRCRMDLCSLGGRGSACGPFQQIARYADHPETENLSLNEVKNLFKSDAKVATEQWKIKRDKYRSRYGRNWVARYSGGDNAMGYQRTHESVRARIFRLIQRQ